MPIASVRVVAGVLLAVVVAGCADEQAATPRPVEERSATSRATTTTVVAPPSTKPLVTAPPSPLLDEVVVSYDAAYADLVDASVAADQHFQRLDDYIGEGQLEKWRSVIRDLKNDGLTFRAANEQRWRRVEELREMGVGDVEITVCRYDPDQVVDRDGNVVGSDDRAFRYVETLWVINGGWKWVGREWLDSGAESDCALPS